MLSERENSLRAMPGSGIRWGPPDVGLKPLAKQCSLAELEASWWCEAAPCTLKRKPDETTQRPMTCSTGGADARRQRPSL